jgi:predicted O-methyltransferase YrrM
MSTSSLFQPFARLTRFWSRLGAIRRLDPLSEPDRLLQFFEPTSAGAIFKPLQMPGELRELFLRVQALRPHTVLEIGTNNGGTLLMLCRAAAPDATLNSVDLPGGKFGGGYSALRIPYYKAFAAARQRVKLMRMDSHATTTLAAVRRELRGRPLDFLFIDGDHSYEGVRQDFAQYGPLVRPRGAIAFHDIRTAAPEVGGGVPRYWDEIKGQYDHEEIVAEPDDGLMGIGLLHVPANGLRG